jgi:hypothetical protein
VQNSWRSSVVAGLTAALIAAAGAEVAAHRLDEYLQAARIALDPVRTDIELDLTPGAAVADAVLAEIDRDRSQTISADEAGAYAAAVQRAISLEVDGTPLSLALRTARFPTVDEMRNGEGTIRIELSAALPPLSPGVHHLLYRNRHDPDIAVYLANALVPASDRITISAQRRDVDQRELIVDYVLDANQTTSARAWYALSIAAALLAIATLWRRSTRAASR